mmetsp:Transcript_104081/g.323616  ORF Transcript_104081/g.323616 Transcript_104081/m.323616 type:complete len:237 (+) Transcript_104081:41-751(+)
MPAGRSASLVRAPAAECAGATRDMAVVHQCNGQGLALGVHHGLDVVHATALLACIGPNCVQANTIGAIRRAPGLWHGLQCTECLTECHAGNDEGPWACLRQWAGALLGVVVTFGGVCCKVRRHTEELPRCLPSALWVEATLADFLKHRRQSSMEHQVLIEVHGVQISWQLQVLQGCDWCAPIAAFAFQVVELGHVAALQPRVHYGPHSQHLELRRLAVRRGTVEFAVRGHRADNEL